MSSSTGGSVSRGVFVYKGKKKSAEVDRYFGSGEDLAGEQERLRLCQDHMERVNEKIQVMQANLNAKIFEDLIQYVNDAQKEFVPQKVTGVTNKLRATEIPTAALVTGVNTPDHAAMFNNLVTMLKEKVTSYTAVLLSKDCPNLKSIMSSAVAQIMDSADLLDDDDEEAEGFSSHRVCGTMAVLEAWYQEITHTNSITSRSSSKSPRKKNKKSLETSKNSKSPGSSPGKVPHSPTKRPASPNNNLPQSPTKKSRCEDVIPVLMSPSKSQSRDKPYPPIVIVLEDLESFTPAVLQDFITICSHHLRELPLVFVFGIATTVTAVHRLLPQEVSSLLCMEKFQAPPSSDYLAQVIAQIVMEPDLPFKLGGKVFHLLVDMFLYHDFSVLKFIQNFHYCILDHYYNNPISILCVPFGDLETQVQNLTHSQIESLRATMSFRRHVEYRPPQEQIQLLEDDSHTKEVLIKFLEALFDYNQCLVPVVSCLHCFAGKLPGQPLGHKLREVYGTVLSSNICDSPEYTEAMALLRSLSRDEISDKLAQCIAFLESESCPDELEPIKSKLQGFHKKFCNIEKLSEEYDKNQESEEEKCPDEKDVKPVAKMSLDSLKQKLQEMDKKKKKLTCYEVVRNETIDYLSSIFRKYLISATKLPFHEVFYYNSASILKKHINGSPRVMLENALSNPYYYLQREDLRSDGMAILPTLPDLCIVYKLHQECGRLINLYDWLQAFVTIVCAGEENEENYSNPKEPNQVLQARFIRAVSELQFLGFIKPTKRKTDHVARLTWGAC